MVKDTKNLHECGDEATPVLLRVGRVPEQNKLYNFLEPVGKLIITLSSVIEQ